MAKVSRRTRFNPASTLIHLDHLMVGTPVAGQQTVRCPECGRAAIPRPGGGMFIEYHHSYDTRLGLQGPKHYVRAESA